ncbi:hypothetical protein DUNSADRAFT_3513 [Dunaliella salina]|uniref:SLC41A/MgtE integral membrane domain-containing protein n=1 Tax=Dunaliella salina TaxID=3046 RepID=A0ABQ7GTT5_DUNSA|nr:hypothetical protein DUNSADRAFT_3513 [Dunaliella salina]|eukprot:KAF5838026.1 hypothetical protein DUNSADRAFT_3513 [Dunaliella salina]
MRLPSHRRRLLHNFSRPQQAAKLSCRASRKAGTGTEQGQGARSNPDRAHSHGSLLARSSPEQGLLQPSTSDSDGEDGARTDIVHYENLSVLQIVSARTQWLALFCLGLIGTAFVIESYEDVIERHVELSFFVPLVMGHGGNTGSQTVSSLIRALALGQVRWRDVVRVVATEAAAGGLIGTILGVGVLLLSTVWDQISGEVGTVVAMSMPVVSLWSNGIAALITLAAHKARLDPTMTAGPFMATVVDTSGLVLYLAIARAFIKGMDTNVEEASLESAQVVTSGLSGFANQLADILPHGPQ